MDFSSLPVGGPSTAFGANLLDDDIDESRFSDLKLSFFTVLYK